MLTKTFRTWLIASLVCTATLTACERGSDLNEVAFEKVPPVFLQTPPGGQLPEGVTPTAYSLDLVTDPAEDTFSGRVEIDVQLDAPHARIWLHSLDQRISTAKARLTDGSEIDASFARSPVEGGVSSLDFSTPVPAGQATLILEYTAPYNFGLAGLYKATQKDRPYLATQMEPIDARRLVPSFDEPRFKTPWTLTVTTPVGNQVITNGALTSQSIQDDGTIRYEFATTRSIQSYLLALAVGPYDMRDGGVLPATDVRDRSVVFRGFAPAGKGPRLQEAMDITEAMLGWQEAYFDYPYPYGKLDIIAVPDFAYGAMENAGAIIYREAALLMDERTPLSRRRAILTIHAHELGHQWFGNLVTPIWWDDIWLNEAFATWISYKTMHALFPEAGFDLSPQRAAIGVMDNDSLASARQIRNPITRNADIMDAFDGITYRKGGGVLSMFETYLGEEAFRDGIRLHMRRFEDGVADVNDFMASLAQGSGDDAIEESFRSFIFQPGIPYLRVTVSCPAPDAGLMGVEQSRYAPLGSEIDTTAQSWTIPFAAQMSGPNGAYTVREMLSEQVTEIPLDGHCPDWVMPNAGGAGYWRFTLDTEAWPFLIEAYSSLSPGEQLSFADSALAAFAASEIEADDLLAALAVNASGDWGATSMSLTKIGDLSTALPTETAREAFKDYVMEAYGPRWEALSNRPNTSLSQGEQLLKTSLFAALLQYGRLEEERARLAAGAAAYVGVINDPDPAALSSETVATAIAIAASDGDSAFYEAALDFARTLDNQRERRNILTALAENVSEADLIHLMDTVQGEAFLGQETWAVSLSALKNHKAQAAAWSKFKADFNTIIARTPEIRKAQTVSAVSSFCEEDAIEAAVSFFEGKASLIPGYERRLAQAEETARLCAAFRKTQGPALANALLNR